MCQRRVSLHQVLNCLKKGNVKIAELIESHNDSDTREDSRLVFEDTARGWEAKAA